MRRSYNATAKAILTTDCLEVTRRLHRNVTEIIKKLDEQKNRTLTVNDVFVPSVEALRAKFKDYCERLLLKDPVGSVHKIEELLWRKAFYEVVYSVKKLRKGNNWNEAEKALLSIHLTVGIGYYHHLILKLQIQYELNLVGIIDFAFVQTESISSFGRPKIGQSKTHSKEVKQCVMRLIHRSLVCLGDLTRYKLELDSNWNPMIANRYYKMAIAVDPNIGMPHNQLGTIANGNNYGLDAVYYFLRGSLCSEPFERTEENLRRNILTYSTCTDETNPVQYCISRLFSLLRLWDQENPNSDKINQECQDLLTNLENSLRIEHVESSNGNSLENIDNIESYLQNCKSRPMLYLTDDMVFKIVTICLMSISRLKSKESNEVQGVVAVTLAILSQLLQFVITRLQEAIMNMTVSDMDATLKMDTYSSQLNNAHDGRVELSECESNGGHTQKEEPSLNPDNNVSTNLNGKDKPVVDTKVELLNNVITDKLDSKRCKKSKNLLSKLRRRKRRTRINSDSDTSDIEQSTLGSSSDEINSDLSETERDDALSEENDIVLSDDGLSDNNTDDEIRIIENTKKEEMNGHASEVSNKTEQCDQKNDTNYLINGEQHATEQVDSKTASDKDSVTNSNSTTTITTNADSTTTSDETNGHLNNQKTISHMAQLKKRSLKSDDILNMLIDKEILASIKVCYDWLRSNPDIVRICANSSRILLKRVMILLNLINIDTDSLKQRNGDLAILSSTERLKLCVRTIPLPEDIDLKGLNLLEDAHKSLDWEILRKYRMNKQEETLLRTLKLIEFGHHLTSVQDTGVRYDEAERLFVVEDAKRNAPKKTGLNENFGLDHSRGKLMRHMGKLWLKAEVRSLESQLRSRLMTLYLVPDHEALTKHTPVLKSLVCTRKFIVVIPTVVISALDEIKRVSIQAREATRWLEMQLRHGSRFVRAQRPQERLALPLIKGPKVKDKEAWLFFQIIECCHYFTQHSNVGFTGDAEAPVVTFLTGCNLDKKTLTFSPDGLAKSAGVNFEHIVSFQTKWKSSSKSHG